MRTNRQTFKIEISHTALAVGSGSLEVLATPILVAFMEETAFNIPLGLASSETTVGIEMSIKHLKPSRVKETISCTAALFQSEGKIHTFTIEAKNEKGEIIGTAEHKRAVINIDKFLAKLDS